MGSSSFTGTLQTEHKDNRLGIWSLKVKVNLCITQHGNNFVVNDFYKLLTWIYGFKNLFSLCFFDCRINKAAYNAKVYIGFQKSHFNLLN